jgi:hypothetical protein
MVTMANKVIDETMLEQVNKCLNGYNDEPIFRTQGDWNRLKQVIENKDLLIAELTMDRNFWRRCSFQLLWTTVVAFVAAIVFYVSIK